jgi:transcriptional regulator with XRE-family HTH domain
LNPKIAEIRDGALRITSRDQIAGILTSLSDMNQMNMPQLAEASGFTKSQVSTWRAGKTVPDIATLIRLANTFGFDVALIPCDCAVDGPDGVSCQRAYGHDGWHGFADENGLVKW